MGSLVSRLCWLDLAALSRPAFPSLFSALFPPLLTRHMRALLLFLCALALGGQQCKQGTSTYLARPFVLLRSGLLLPGALVLQDVDKSPRIGLKRPIPLLLSLIHI